MKEYCFVCKKEMKNGSKFFEPNENLDGSISGGYWRSCHPVCKYQELDRRESERKFVGIKNAKGK